MDNYTKSILTIIALCLILITIKLWEPVESHAGLFDNTPRIGDFYKLKNIQNAQKRKDAYKELIYNIPFVQVRGGNIDADID